MKPAFHYIVKAKLIRYIKHGEINFIELEEKFENENPIIAREESFRYYQNFIDVLLEGLGDKYIDDKDARNKLTSFIDSGTETKVKFGDIEFEITDSYGNGIGVYIVIDTPFAIYQIDESLEDKIGDEFLIHGIAYSSGADPQRLIDGLNTEYSYYEHYGYDIKDYKRTVNFYEYDIQESDLNHILETPFDWTGYDIPYHEINDNPNESKNEETSTDSNKNTYKQLIDEGENNQVEFKPNMLYYHDKDKEKSGYRKFVRHIIAKVICSFLNSNGGYLFIGVQDNKEITGLADDFSLVRPEGKDPKDYFTSEVDKIIRYYFKKFASNIQGEFTTIDNKEIYVFKVFPSKYKPVFINGKSSKEFYVRLMGSCEPYTDIEDITTYCIDQWGK